MLYLLTSLLNFFAQVDEQGHLHSLFDLIIDMRTGGIQALKKDTLSLSPTVTLNVGSIQLKVGKY